MIMNSADDENANYWVDNNTLITTAVPVAPDWKLIQNKQKTLETNKGSFPIPKRMNFRKSSKRPLTPPPIIFGKLYCGFRDKNA